LSTQFQAATPHRSHRTPDPPHPVGSNKVVALRLVGGAIALWGLLSLIGLIVTHVLTSGRLHSWDRGVDVWFAAHRTSSWNIVTVFGSGLANTQTAIAVTAVVVLVLRWRLGRWYESWVVFAAIAGELLVFLAVTATVHRPRPPVTRLDVAPPTSSFPSGHTAAAIALYGCLAVVLLWIYGRGPAVRVMAVVLVCFPVIVGFSRLYRGMHYPSDVLVGALGGGLWLLVVITTLLPGRGARRATDAGAAIR
jgi:membrane-associated phospholipid phosphatase